MKRNDKVSSLWSGDVIILVNVTLWPSLDAYVYSWVGCCYFIKFTFTIYTREMKYGRYANTVYFWI